LADVWQIYAQFIMRESDLLQYTFSQSRGSDSWRFAGRPDGQWLQALHGVFIVGWLIHGFLLRKRNKHDPR